MSLNKQIKKHTRDSLKGNRICVIFSSMIILLLTAATIFLEKIINDIIGIDQYVQADITTSKTIISVIPNTSFTSFYITFVSIFIFFIIINPLWAGLKKTTIDCVITSYGDFFNLFYFFRNYKIYCKFLLLKLYIFIRMILSGFIFILPGTIAILLDQRFSEYNLFMQISINGYNISFITLFGIILIVLGLVINFIYSSKYFLSVYICIKFPRLSVFKCVKYSSRFTKGEISNLFNFKLSFIPIILSTITILPVFYVIPYYISCCSSYAMYLIEYGMQTELEGASA